MRVCFFGHRDAPACLVPQIEKTVRRLIEAEHAEIFYVGSQGAFDRMVQRVLVGCKVCYPHIRAFAVLAYFPNSVQRETVMVPLETIYPECLESVPRRFAIARRNEWMIEQSDLVVTYVRSPAGGARQYKDRAERKGKPIIELASEE